jgi:omega-hydroxy-beta-dihydromenaquinone-9 sulfotransferase
MPSFPKRIWVTYKTTGRIYGVWLSSLFTFLLYLILRITVWLGQIIDLILFRSVLKQEIQAPIIIVGNPRTGTTFLQRFIDNNNIAVGQQVWQQLYPSVVIQKFLLPVLPLLEKISPARHHSTVAHQTSLSSVETDDVSIFFRYFDGFFLYGFFLANAEEDLLSWFDQEDRNTRDRDFALLYRSWQRNLYTRKHDRIVAKLFSVGADLGTFQKQFPDAKILYMARDPIEMIPSCLSLITGVLEKRFQFSKLPIEIKKRYFQRMSEALLELQRRFVQDWNDQKVHVENIKIIPYTRLLNDFEELFQEIIEFIGHFASSELLEVVRLQAEEQVNYRSQHRYDLSQFYLDETQLREQSKFFYDFLSEVE